jgi:hypothetical protein
VPEAFRTEEVPFDFGGAIGRFGLLVSHKRPSEDKAQNPQATGPPGRDTDFACVSY